MLVALCNDFADIKAYKSILDKLIYELEQADLLSDDEVAYYLMSVCNVFTIEQAKKLGMPLVNLEHQAVIKRAEKSKIFKADQLAIWRKMNYDRNQIAHGYDTSFNRELRKNLTIYLKFIKENK